MKKGEFSSKLKAENQCSDIIRISLNFFSNFFSF